MVDHVLMICSVCLVVVVSGSRADGRRSCHRMFLILPGGKEFAHHGIVQGHDPSGLRRPVLTFAWTIQHFLSAIVVKIYYLLRCGIAKKDKYANMYVYVQNHLA